ncbi:MAG: O-antigen ligase family protein [Thermoleophilia bacterium]|nr:O-antigen ligase family protein [Thermoleophilia bacterium]
MSSRPHVLPRPRPGAWLAIGVVAAAALGAVTSLDARAGIGIAVAMLIAIVVAIRPEHVLSVLVASVFVEIVTVGGVAIGRLTAPVALLVLLLQAARGQASLRYGPPLAWACAYALLALASGLWTSTLGPTTHALASLAIACVYALCFASLLGSRSQLRAVLVAMSVAALVVGLVAIAAFLGGSAERASGGKGDPNFFAAFQIVALPFTLVLAAETRKRWHRYAFYTLAVVITGSILSSLSRGGLVALAGIVLVTVLLPARAIFRSRAQKAAVLLVLACAFVISFQAASSEIAPRFQSIFAREDTGSGRLNEWLAAWGAIKSNPGLGLGYGGFLAQSNELMLNTPGVDFSDFRLRPEGSEAHNAYIGTAADLGIPGLALFVGLIAATMRQARRTARAAAAAGDQLLTRVANALLVSLIGWAIASLFLSSETSRPLWIMVGLSLALPRLIREQDGPAEGLTPSGHAAGGR